MQHFQGIWVALATPFRDGQVDYPAARHLARHLQEAGVAGLVVAGSTGEGSTLSPAERRRLLAEVMDAVGPGLPVAVGLGGNDTAQVAAAAAELADSGAAGLLLSAPWYSRPSQEGIRRHFEAVAAATDLPILIYNIPYRTGVNMEVATVKALSRNPRIKAIKESSGGNLEQLAGLINDTPLQVLSGEDNLIFITGCLGGHGAISAAAHIRPDLYVKMWQALQAGNLAEARRIDTALRPLIKLLFAEPNPGPVKAALACQGLIREELRLPMTPVSESCRERIRDLVATAMAL